MTPAPRSRRVAIVGAAVAIAASGLHVVLSLLAILGLSLSDGGGATAPVVGTFAFLVLALATVVVGVFAARGKSLAAMAVAVVHGLLAMLWLTALEAARSERAELPVYAAKRSEELGELITWFTILAAASIVAATGATASWIASRRRR
jgi:hypothetical protein